MLRALWLLLSLAACSSFRLERCAAVGRAHAPRTTTPVLMPKSKKPARKKQARKKSTQEGLQPMMDESPAPLGSMSNPAPSPGLFAAPEQGGSREERLDTVLRSAGFSPSDSAKVEAARKDESPLASIPVKGQELLEKFFGTGALLFGGIFITAGIGVSIEATCKILGYQLPVPFEEAIVQYVEPALTPSILILFGFSISLGLLKQLQMTAGTAGVLYQEGDDD
mmetsp:Transcript_10751/g.21802  ORF Transcript_10751/g.21802 Transcript_10751/m.21802 type:complete len:224 (+) Transcript_10751:69-740(+)|eukprot:CAMPEP_0119071332 /NCGR_PEP_ID=MMETSP1178-20130426/48673_1 /TAXON_ID=33656 /ORGANISM="unid sp, Strain CCMP2000" /LENGTH=223 /DNA_ID=CAMNT_0007053253 /DNA_START=69 /DNA_END=740 /DNA_ORIENTATION=-